jgi:hypothetical protein
LLDVRHSHDVDNEENIEIPQSIVTFNKDELISKIYKDIKDITLTPLLINYSLDHAILAP